MTITASPLNRDDIDTLYAINRSHEENPLETIGMTTILPIVHAISSSDKLHEREVRTYSDLVEVAWADHSVQLFWLCDGVGITIMCHQFRLIGSVPTILARTCNVVASSGPRTFHRIPAEEIEFTMEDLRIPEVVLDLVAKRT